MKILIVHNQLWAHYKAIIFNELYKIMVDNNRDELLVVQLATIEKSRVDLGSIDTSIHQYPYKLLHQGTLEEVKFWQKVWGIKSAIDEFKPNVVNLTGYYDLASWLILFYCKFKGIKTILSNESTAGDHTRQKIKEKIKSLIINQFDGYFNFGTLSKNYLLTLGAKKEKMLVNRNCVDNATLNKIYQQQLPNRDWKQKNLGLAKNNFIFVGRLIEYKNLLTFLEAFAEAQILNSANWGLIILGDGEQKADLIKLVEKLQIRNVNFQTGVSWQQVPEFLALSDVLVLPSYSEPWGLVVNEAMACGLPVLVSEKCGCSIDLVKNGKNGYTFSPYNKAEMTELFLKFMENNQDIYQMGLTSQQIIQEYSAENVAKEMYAGYSAVL